MRRAAKTATPGKRESLTNFESKMLSLALPGGYFDFTEMTAWHDNYPTRIL